MLSAPFLMRSTTWSTISVKASPFSQRTTRFVDTRRHCGSSVLPSAQMQPPAAIPTGGDGTDGPGAGGGGSEAAAAAAATAELRIELERARKDANDASVASLASVAQAKETSAELDAARGVIRELEKQAAEHAKEMSAMRAAQRAAELENSTCDRSSARSV